MKINIQFYHISLESSKNQSNWAPSGRIFMKFDVKIFRKYVDKILNSLKSYKYNVYFIGAFAILRKRL